MTSNRGVVNTIDSWNTGYSADSVEWCPIEFYQHIFVCGTYQLDKGAETNPSEDTLGTSDAVQKRLGKIYLFTIDVNAIVLELKQTIETAAVLDQKWCYHSINGFPVLGVVNADGALDLYKLVKSEEESFELVFIVGVKVNEDSKVLALSLDWSTGKNMADEPQIVVSDSHGDISVFVLQNCDKLVKLHCWNAHGFEAWICAFDYWNPSVLFSGGDDAIFKLVDLRCGTDFKILNRSHGAGVTSFHSNSHREHLLASGSYDEILRLWDTRKLKHPLAEKNLGGGIWRLKWDPIQHDMLLAACMYGGFAVLNSKDSSSVNIIAEYNDHGSIAYGADWCHDESFLRDEDDNDFSEITSRAIATCSFYDCKLNIAKLKY